MPKIHILAEEVRNQIAAGEVIERPASVIKELVENSLDAKADNITMVVDHGGKDLIQVIDNGSGMNEDDALLALERHATSKIRRLDDITHISSLGFRGEALPSIASVCRFTMITRNEDSPLATGRFFGGKTPGNQQNSLESGDFHHRSLLFKNIPPGGNLGSDNAELRHILKYVHYQAILYPTVSFKLVVDGKERLNLYRNRIELPVWQKFFGSIFLLMISSHQCRTRFLQAFRYIFGLESAAIAGWRCNTFLSMADL